MSLERRNRVLSAARRVAEALDTKDERLANLAMIACRIDYGTKVATYTDDVVEIVASLEDEQIAIRRVYNGNPVFSCKPNGDMVRFHGEFWQVAGHIEKIGNPLYMLAKVVEDD